MNKTIEELAVELTVASVKNLDINSKEDVGELFKYYHQTIKETYLESSEEIKKANSVKVRPKTI
ncbi:hypothetical protein [Bacillus licheniformis]|uniref:hypothetical protein n=1 Tax=Bacillus licheniformis TaxID=1402 RepID=UPI002E24F344|nr:hypothetical protein [Bacillus licheniformis]MED4306586.1 hypothetical protein [Bacillus licheniformis]MED4342380.1 hypothetical protein [Bacillus licheniformis]MED4374020.1 hypothetical protein [Bacillus licheniformis]MED4382758.1 hypothetical protein [Bacillus licheniformis]